MTHLLQRRPADRWPAVFSTWVLTGAMLMLLVLALPGLARAQDVLPVPALSARVIDQTATLAEPERAALEAKLAAFEAEAGPQIAILLVPTTLPEDITSYAQRIADAWKIGRREVGDGVLLVVAKDDRRVRIEVAKALEGAVPDLAARQVIDRAITPAFRAGDYARGLDQALDQLIARIRGEDLPPPERSANRGQPGLQLEELLIFFFAAVPIIGSVFTGVMGRKLGAVATAGAAGGLSWWMTASLWLAGGAVVGALVLVGLFGLGAASRSVGRRGNLPHIGGWGGGYGGRGGGSWGGGGGGGGFSSGGGGNFGGGGASGGW